MFAVKMVATCSAHNCNNRQMKNSIVSFHRFPLHNPQLLQKWLTAMKREDFEPNKFSFLCSDHFTPTDYESRPFGGRCKLKHNAIPSVFNFPVFLLKQEDSQKPHLVKREISQKPHLVKREDSQKPHLMKQEDSQKPHLVKQEVSQKPHLVKQEVPQKPYLLKQEVSQKPYLVKQEVSQKPYLVKQEVSQKPYLVKQEISQKPQSEMNISSATNSSSIYGDHVYCGLKQRPSNASLSLLKPILLDEKQVKQKDNGHKYDVGIKKKDENIEEEEEEEEEVYYVDDDDDTEVKEDENTEVEEDDEDIAVSDKKYSDFVENKIPVVQNNSSVKELVSSMKQPVVLKRKDVFHDDPRVMEAYKIMKKLHRQMNDDCSVFTEHIANKLRSYDTHTRAVVELLINNILFEADIGTYKEDSD